MSTQEMQDQTDKLLQQIKDFRGLFSFMMDMGDFAGMEDAFNGIAQIAHGALALVDPTLPAADPTRETYALFDMDRIG